MKWSCAGLINVILIHIGGEDFQKDAIWKFIDSRPLVELTCTPNSDSAIAKEKLADYHSPIGIRTSFRNTGREALPLVFGTFTLGIWDMLCDE